MSRLESAGLIARSTSGSTTTPGSAPRSSAPTPRRPRSGSGCARVARWGGVGGTRAGVKCLHAHYAYHLAGGDDPVGAWVAERVEPIHAEEAPGERIAVVDQGTHSCRLLVVERRADGAPRSSRADMVITQLGQGVDATRPAGPRRPGAHRDGARPLLPPRAGARRHADPRGGHERRARRLEPRRVRRDGAAPRRGRARGHRGRGGGPALVPRRDARARPRTGRSCWSTSAAARPSSWSARAGPSRPRDQHADGVASG